MEMLRADAISKQVLNKKHELSYCSICVLSAHIDVTDGNCSDPLILGSLYDLSAFCRETY